MTTTLRVAFAQMDPTVGAVHANTEEILEAIDQADAGGADVIVFGELAVTGYPPEDLLGREDLLDADTDAIARICAHTEHLGVTVVVGHVARTAGRRVGDAEPRALFNAAAVIRRGQLIATADKRLLPDYGLFDETRWFRPGTSPVEVFEVAGVPCAVLICEDLWTTQLATEAADAGARILLVPNASPWHYGKQSQRLAVAHAAAATSGATVVYVNQSGGQDGVVFDGNSFAVTPDGAMLPAGRPFARSLDIVDVPAGFGATGVHTAPPAADEHEEADTWNALCLGVYDYVTKNRFDHVCIGLSGGIDSAVTAAIAVDALGPDAVTGVLMPSAVSSEGSVTDAEDLAKRLGINTWTLPIAEPVAAINTVLRDGPFAGTGVDVAEENIQARVRGLYLMGLANKRGGIVLTTGNKSELAVGYCTLYGDMSGGLGVLADVPKTLVYRLAQWRNDSGPDAPIPHATIIKPPSAELAEGQQDADSLPPYELLDEILDAYIDQAQPPAVIARRLAAFHGPEVTEIVARVVAMVDRNEYKRRQAAPGIRVTARAFGRDRRLPITNGWRAAAL